MTVLITGGLGYLGSQLIRELPNNPYFSGETIRILDNFRQPRFQSLWDLPTYADYEFVEADIRDEKAVEAAMTDVDTVFHLAAITNASETFDIEEKTWEVNLDGALNVFEAATEASVESFINASTCSVYGRTEEEIQEGFQCDPESPYGEAKLRAEQEMLDRADGDVGLTALRLGTVYGWTPGMRFDTVVDKFALLAATGQPLTVYKGAEDQQRPYLHVKDAVSAMLFSARELGDCQTYNVVGQNARLRDVVNAVERHFPDVEIGYTSVEHLDQLSYVVSNKKIRAEGFRTGYTLDQGVKELKDKFRALV